MAKSIINADDGSVSGVPGIKTSGGDENSLVIQSVGSDVVELNGTGLDLLTGAIKANGNSVIDTSGNIDATQVSVGGSTVIDSSGNVNAASEFTINGSSVLSGDSFTIPSGTTGERPASPELGMLRYNTDNSELEQYDGAEWSGIGGGAAGAELVASGSIPGAGTSVALLSDGTVEVVDGSVVTEGTGTKSAFSNSYTTSTSAIYDSAAGKVVIVWRDLSDFARAIVGTVSGSNITFGSPNAFTSSASNVISAVYEPNAGKVVIAYADQVANQGKAVVATVSGDSISFGSETVFNSNDVNHISAVYEPTAGKIVIAYADSSEFNYGKAIVGTVSGTSISFGSKNTFKTSDVLNTSMVYEPNAGKVVIVYREGGGPTGQAIVGTVSGTSISFGSDVTFHAVPNGNLSNISTVYEPTAGKVVIAFGDLDNLEYGTVVIGTVSGTSISFGSNKTVFYSGKTESISAVYEPAAGQVVIAYSDADNNQYGTVVRGTVSGDSISFSSETIFYSGDFSRASTVYEPSVNKVVIAYADGDNSNYGTAITYNPEFTSTNADDFIGFAQDSASDTDTVLVATNQQIDANQTSLTPKSTYYVDFDGTLTTSDTGYSVAGFALDSNTLRVGG